MEATCDAPASLLGENAFFKNQSGKVGTDGWRTTLKINRSDLRALKANGCWSCLPLLYSRYLVKIWGFVFRGL